MARDKLYKTDPNGRRKRVEKIKTGFGARLKNLLEERGIRVRKLAEETKVNEQTIYSIIRRDSTNISINSFLSICEYLNVSPEFFLEKSDLDARVSEDGLSPEYVRVFMEAKNQGFTPQDIQKALEFMRYIRSGRD
jgi:transcriptional regulator with XRE-family HTH domain